MHLSHVTACVHMPSCKFDWVAFSRKALFQMDDDKRKMLCASMPGRERGRQRTHVRKFYANFFYLCRLRLKPFSCGPGTRPTLSHFFKLQNQSQNLPKLNKTHRYPDLEALKLCMGRSGINVDLIPGKVNESRIDVTKLAFLLVTILPVLCCGQLPIFHESDNKFILSRFWR